MRKWKKRAASLILSGLCMVTPCVYAAPASVLTANAASFVEHDVLNGYSYYAYNMNNTGKYEFANTADDCFRVSWENSENSTFSKGREFKEKKPADYFVGYSVDYDADVNFDGICSLGITGWMEDPKIEFNILENWSGALPFEIEEESKIATYTTGGNTYDAYRFYNMSGDPNDLQGWTEIWCVKADSDINAKEDVNVKGNVSMTEHFQAWKENGIELGNVSSISLAVSGYMSSGKVDVNSFEIDGIIRSEKDGNYEVPVNQKIYDENGYFYANYYDEKSDCAVKFENTKNNGFTSSWDSPHWVYEVMKGKEITEDNILDKDYGDYYVTYDGDVYCTGNSFQLSVEGWIDPKVEFYILDYWCEFRPCNNSISIGSYTCNGDTYDMYWLSISNGDLLPNENDFYQLWCIRRDSEIKAGEHSHISRKINLADHFRAWKDADISRMNNVSCVSLHALTFGNKGELNINSLKIGGINKNEYINVLDKFGNSLKYDENGYFYFTESDDDIKGILDFENTENNGFDCSWDDEQYCCFEKGKEFPNGKFKVEDFDDYCITYDGDVNYTGDAFNLLADAWIAPKLELCILDCWCEWKPCSSYPSIGSYTCDGNTYDMYILAMFFGDIMPSDRDYRQLWSIKRDSEIESGVDSHISGNINLGEHLKAWKDAGYELEGIPYVSLLAQSFTGKGEMKLNSLEIGKNEQSCKVGDLNNDRCIDVFDIILCRKALISKINGENVNYNADVNGDGEFSVSDLVMLSGYVSGRNTTFSADKK